ncbi:MAG: nucleoside transporter rane protein [Chthonomonadaceae bacterium]|nr:nucleoside transporter rane protein [Chthonomonadaceae bacterium]
MTVVGGALLGTLSLATPLLLAALGETVVQRSGVVNVGLEGMMLTGAFAAFVGTVLSVSLPGHIAGTTANPYVGLVAAILAGMLIALLFALFAVRLAANQVVVGVVVNLLALGLTGTLLRTLPRTESGFLNTQALPQIFFNQTILTPLALIAVPGVWWWLFRTRRGLELRACGEQPVAAEAAGIPVMRRRTAAILFGGAMAGLAGAFLSVGDVPTFQEGMSAGRGFIALAIVTSGRWNPWGCLAAALIFGFTDRLQIQGQAIGLHVPHDLLLALPYVATLLILAFGSGWSVSPAALGRPYRRT